MKQTIVVTGGAGFIGSNYVRELNENGFEEIIIVDSLNKQSKWRNLLDLKFIDFLNYQDGLEKIIPFVRSLKPTAVFHLGANSDVLVTDANRMVQLNYEHSKAWLNEALNLSIPFLFASSSAVYGNSNSFSAAPGGERSHNPYALSKWMFDSYVRKQLAGAGIKIIGFRFFNTYGRGEDHKGRNASLPHRFFHFLRQKGGIELFANGEKISRDYISVKDTVKAIRYAYQSSLPNGIYNLGSGRTLSHAALAALVIDEYARQGLLAGSKEDAVRLIPFPPELTDNFQFFTRAEEMDWLSGLSIREPEAGIREYIAELAAAER